MFASRSARRPDAGGATRGTGVGGRLRGRRWVGRREGDDGYLMVMFALLIVPLMAFAALGVDVGSWYARGSQLQKAADAASLAGVVWMPDLTTATSVATASLQQNSIIAGGSIDVSIVQGSEASTLKVTITDHDPASYFSQMFLHVSLTRTATAQYVLPIPMGSPLNYFGGDAGQYPGTPASTQSSFSPPNATTFPDQYKCALAASGQGSSPPAKSPSPSSSRPPGYYDNSSQLHNGTPPDTGNDPSEYPAQWAWSNSLWNWQISTVIKKNNGTVKSVTISNIPYPVCQWGTTVAAVPGPIDPNQSPGFWAAVEGPATNSINGDAYSPRCYSTGANCSSVSNPQYRSTGYWYTIAIPETNSPSSVAVQVFDASYNPKNGQTKGAGDNALSGSYAFHTVYSVYQQNIASDFTSRTAVPGCSWDLTSEAAYQNVWQTLCNLTPSAGDIYQVNVRSYDPNNQGDGSNNYALRAVPNVGGGLPKLSAYGDMAIFNNIKGTSGSYAVASFYLVDVPEKFAGKVLDIDLWDPGDTNGNAWLTVLAPSSTSTAGAPVPNTDCTYSADHPANPPSGVGSPVSSRSPTSGDQNFTGGSGTCSVQTSNGGAIYNGEWVHIRVTIPSDYTCDDTVNPVTTAGSCWWQVRYTFASQAHDNTTWASHIEGNPVHLIQ